MKKQKTEKMNKKQGASPVFAQKGITLIALIITIIVMLILVAVTISMAVNGRLFEYAGRAAKETNNAMIAEGQLGGGKVTVDNKVYNSIDEYLQSNKNSGTSTGITAATMQNDLKSYLGKTIAYGVEYDDASDYGNNEWEIFYADEEHIYIITKGHLASGSLSTTGYNGTSDFTAESVQTKYPAVGAGLLNKTYDPTSVGSELKYSSKHDNMKATQYLLDSEVELWANLVNDDYANWAIGAPTYELFVNSFNTYYPENAVILESPSGRGYPNPLGTYGILPTDTYLTNSDYGYWIACPPKEDDCYVRYYNYGRIACSAYGSEGPEFRPVVCLSSDVQITWDEATSAYTISKAS